MTLNKTEAKTILSFAKANRDCDLDSPQYGEPHIRIMTKPEIMKHWNGIIRKLKKAAK